jgi:anti-sigma regulatory factor (Ser/Thr protein kinase)
MNAASATAHTHEVALYHSESEYLSIVVPFLEEGLAEDEPTLVGCGPMNTELIQSTLGEPSGLTYLPVSWDDGPATVIRSYREMLADLMATGAARVRALGDVPHPGYGVPWEWWGRYEAAVNHVFADFPLWGLCSYDVRITPDDVLDEVIRTHPYSTSGLGRHEPNPLFEDPTSFMLSRTTTYRDPLEMSDPLHELDDPSPAGTRAATRSACAIAGLAQRDTDDLLIAVSEVVTNAIQHGKAPRRVRIWVGPRRVFVTVTDAGSGPDDPFAGLLPPRFDEPAGRGLWIAHQLCCQVSMDVGHDGFTVRLLAGERRDSSQWAPPAGA